MWPLDVCIVALAGLVLYVITTRLQFDDPRWLYNAWTYIVAVPVIAVVLTFLSHGLVSRHIQKSIQLGFLFSVFVHLLLLLLAINVIIFSRYFPDAFSKVMPERSPVRNTVPEYLFQTEEQTPTPPDWSQPVDATTAARVEPEQPIRTPPLQNTAARRELPQPPQPPQPSIQPFMVPRRTPSESLPQPAESPARMAERSSREIESPQSTSLPVAPDVAVDSNPAIVSNDRRLERQQRSGQPSTATPTAPRAVEVPLRAMTQPSLAGARSLSQSMPQVGESGPRQQRSSPSTDRNFQPVGSSPASQSIAVATNDVTSPRLLAPAPTPVTRQGQSIGAQLTPQPQAISGLPAVETMAAAGPLSRNLQESQGGLPSVTPGNAQRAPGRARQGSGIGFEPAGTPTPGRLMADAPVNLAGEATNSTIGDRLADDETARRSARRDGERAATSSLSPTSPAGLDFEFPLSDRLPGLANRSGMTPGSISDMNEPRIAALDIPRGMRPRKDVGGPITPAGKDVTAVESFARRVMRTRGGAAPTPAGMVGPATEEAIELGLTYLAKTQNEDGSWSLQGHGTEVALQSNTAATGLCLLAFQGAGYTHREHQYIETVNRGLQYLVRIQKANGDLYQSENQISDQNVALYSHGIAALALCEAYGMTQDPELKGPAQLCLDYIVNTQHRQRGGWRYAPQVSADTSVTGWMMMALKSGQLSGLDVPDSTYNGIDQWLQVAQSPDRPDRYRYNPFAPDTPTQRHGRTSTPTMTAVGMLMRMYLGWRRDTPAMQSAADYLLEFPPEIGTTQSPQRDTYYWYYATQVMFHMGGETWYEWNRSLNPLLLESQIKSGPLAGSWDPMRPVPDRWAIHAGRLYVTTMNLLNLEVYYRHLPIYDDTAD